MNLSKIYFTLGGMTDIPVKLLIFLSYFMMDKNYLLYVISFKILFDEICRFILNVCKPKMFENKNFHFEP